MRRMDIRAGAAAVALLAVALLGWLVLSPGWAIAMMQEQVQSQLARGLDVKGGAHLTLAPLAIRLDNASLAMPAGQEGSFITARSIRIPLSFTELLTRSPGLTAMTLEGAEMALLVDERGRASWSFPAVKTPAPLTLSLDKASLRYFDARNGQSLAAGNVTGILAVGADGNVGLTGTAEIKGRLARIDASLKSLARVHEDGSPIDVSLQTPEASATFSGRIATAKVLSLAGPVSITSSNLRAAARWAGLAVEEGSGYGPLSIDGGLDSAGRAFAIRRAAVALDQFRGAGELVIDLRNDIPKLQANLSAPAFTLDGFLPVSGAKPGDWGMAPLGFAVLKSVDAEISIDTPAFSYGAMAAMPARLVTTIIKSKLDAAAAVRTGQAGTIAMTLGIDATAQPERFSLSLKAENAEAGALLKSLTGIGWLRGTGTITAALSGAGRTQQEIIGSLKGSASLALGQGVISSVDLGAMLGAVSQRILDGWAMAGTTPFQSLAAEFTVADGIAKVASFTLGSPSLSVAATGDIDLLRRAVDLRAEPRIVTAGTGEATGLPVAIIVRGPWDRPRLYPDIPGILIDPKGGYATLKAKGLPASN